MVCKISAIKNGTIPRDGKVYSQRGFEVPMNELRAQVAEAVKAKWMRKAKIRTNQEYLKMSRKQLENFLQQERRYKLGASITRFAVSAEESDEEKAKRKREKAKRKNEKRLLKIRSEITESARKQAKSKGNDRNI